MGLIPGRGTKISHAIKQLRLHATATEPTHHNYRVCVLQPKICIMQPRSHMPPLTPDAAKKINKYCILKTLKIFFYHMVDIISKWLFKTIDIPVFCFPMVIWDSFWVGGLGYCSYMNADVLTVLLCGWTPCRRLVCILCGMVCVRPVVFEN